ncbi:AMP-binding protein [Noviherbaspirillum sedimenti]|uniref:Acyl-CoA synthetase n=1 Tax=Noviherbaspirillum sedimenti TaxID=2320865 RepID=A0A3A3G472_9BURK|nr:AMP-binding protein [Noviherbaspirillum sedimenti]RJG01599.1 acyl-CoA synthetase [Noviherbaspirillum sedimenti]
MQTNQWNDPGLRPRAANFDALTPVTFLDRAAKVFPDRIAIVYGNHRESWSEHATTCRRFASALMRAGIKRGDVVALLMTNTPPMLAAHFAVPMAGAVLNTVNTRLDAETISYILEHCEARLLIVDAEFLELAQTALAQIRKPPRLIAFADLQAGFAAPRDVEIYESFLASGDANAPTCKVDDEWTPIAVNYTSGTTGRPKGVVYSHRGAYLSAVSSIVSWGVPKGASYLWTLPLFHCNGWCMPWILALQGGKNVCLRRVDGETIVQLITDERVTHYCGAPIVHALIRDRAQHQDLVFDPSVSALIGGAPPPASLIAAMDSIGVRLTHIYGLTETYGPAAICEQQPAWDRLSDAERADRNARQGVNYALQAGMTVMASNSTAEVKADGSEIGEIVFRGNMTMMGYLKDSEATDRAFDGGWFRSGDLAVLESDGYVRIKDRSKDIIISGGENISSVEVEDILYRHEAVAAAAVVAMPDEKWGEVPVAFVELRDERDISEDALIAHCREHLAHFKCPKRIVLHPIPKTATGKIQKNVLREAIRRNEVSALDSAPAKERARARGIP